MTSETGSNGHHPASEAEREPVNAYMDAVTGSRPRELVQFELNTDPYANMIPRVSTMTSGEESPEDSGSRRRSPVVVAISLLLIAVLVLPITAEVFARLIH